MESNFATPICRRNFVKLAATAGLGLATGYGFSFAPRHNDDALLDDLSQRCFQYFADAIDPVTGICKDLIHGNPDDNTKKGDEARGSTGVTGFALTAMCIGAERGWISRQKAKDNVRHALQSYTNGKVVAEHGWFYHFNDVHTGARWKDVEMSTSDSIWLLAAALTCRQYFHEDPEIRDLATLLYSRYDFPWMTNGDGKLLSHGWRPEGFIALRYDKYCQLAAMYLLGIGSPTHSLPPRPGMHGSGIRILTLATTTSGHRCCGPISIPSHGSIFAVSERSKVAKSIGGRTAR